MAGKRELIGNVNNVTSYTMSHNSTNILHREPLGSSVVEGVCFISKKAKGHTCRYLKTIGESINSTFHAWVVIERVVIEVAEFKNVSL